MQAPCHCRDIKACALIGLHMIAEEATSSSLSGLCRELGEMWRYGGPRNHNVECHAPEVTGQVWSSEVVSLFFFLEIGSFRA